jgi:hypothetical protein
MGPVTSLVESAVEVRLLRLTDRRRRIQPHSGLIPAALMIGHHFSISAFCSAPSGPGAGASGC